MKKIISTEALKVGYDKKVVIDNVDVQGMKGQLICLLGPNGAGKSTILRTLTGLLAPVNGCVYIGEKDINKIKKQELAKKMAVVLTEQLSLSMMTVYEIASMGRYPHTNFRGKLTEDDRKVIEESLKAVKAFHLKDRYFSQLSDGEKQKIMIARALVQEPEIVVLDEPTSHLDIKHKVEVINILRGLCKERGITVVLSLHDIDLAVKGCETLMLIQGGKVIAKGMPEEIISTGTIQKLYGIKEASYCELMGSLEFKNTLSDKEVFIISGNGSGAGIFRAVSREGLGMCCGVLHQNDVDFYIANSLGGEVISENSFERISEEVLSLAINKLNTVEFVIETAFPIGEINKLNLKIVEEAIKKNKIVYSLCDNKELNHRYREYADRIIVCSNISEIIADIKVRRSEKYDASSV